MSIFEQITLLFSAVIAVSAFMTFLAICIQGLIFNGQLGEMKKSTDAATKAAKAAEDSVTFARESAHLDQRAWVGPMGIRGNPPEVNKDFVADVTVKNRGRTFARKVEVKWHVREVPRQQTPDFDNEMDTPSQTSNSVGLMPPDGEYIIKAHGAVRPDQAIVDRIQSGAVRVFIFGKLTYTDVFDCSHWTTFCYALKTDGTYEIWETHNDADDNRF